MKEFKVQVPDGYEIDKEKSTFESIVFKEKNNLPTSWKELGEINGHYVNSFSGVVNTGLHSCEEGNKNIFATREQAEASLALSQLTQLLKAYNGDWKPDWSNSKVKHCIDLYNDCWCSAGSVNYNNIFSFETEEKREHFLKHHIELLNKVKPLFGG
jgi:hypothetical protein